ncbi:MAG: hypothetical protein IKC29_01875 [Clostridia bacterium]|nr:hypothetical protein [Clostridia bacterium]
MKRKILLFSLILVMACMSLALLGSDTLDGNLSMDEDDFVELVVDAPLSLHYLESVYSLKAVNQIVGNEGEDGFAEVLYNANDEAEYVLATAEEGGYVIFHRMTGALMEAGEFGASPYAGQSGKKYYFGPSNYAVKDVNDVTTDIMRGGVVTTEQITAMHQYMARKRTEFVESAGIKNYAEMQNALVSFQTYEAQQNGEAVAAETVPSPWSGNPYANQVDVNAFTEIEHSCFYKYLKDASEFGNNTHGSCKFVSTVLLLRYHDAYYAPALIPNESIPQTWIDECADAIDILGKDKDGNVDYYSCEVSQEDSVYEALHKYLIAEETNTGFSIFGTHGYSVTRYNNGLPSCISVSNTKDVAQLDNNLFNNVKGRIDNNTPIAVSIGYEVESTGSSGFHVIVVYGYLENESGKYYKAHFGWDGCSTIIVPHDFASGESNYLSVTDTHSEGNEHNCTQYGTKSGLCFANEGHKYYPTGDGSGHLCGCGETHTHEGLGIIDSWEDYGTFDASEYRELLLQGKTNDTHHFNVCNNCMQHYAQGESFQEMNTSWYMQYQDIVGLFPSFQWTNSMAPHRMGPIVVSGGTCMTECSDCGHLYELSWRHKGYRYTNVNALFHDIYCIGCNEYMGRGEHMFNSKNVCTVCGGGAMQPIPIT